MSYWTVGFTAKKLLWRFAKIEIFHIERLLKTDFRWNTHGLKVDGYLSSRYYDDKELILRGRQAKVLH